MTDPDLPNTPPERDQLLREAADWFFRMQKLDARLPESDQTGSGEPSDPDDLDADALRQAFRVWLSRGALHMSAYNRAAELYAMGKVLQAPDATEPITSSSSSSSRWSKLAFAAGLVVASMLGVGVISYIALPGRPGQLASVQAPGQTMELVSRAGETTRTRLPDGSFVTLRGDSLLTVEFDGARRRLHLFRGAGLFEVAHEARPFMVDAGGGMITARGTVFDVAISPQHRVTVRLIRGEIDVVAAPRSVGGSLPAARRLSTNDAISFDEPGPIVMMPNPIGKTGGPLPVRPEENVVESSADVMHEFDEIRLADLVAVTNGAGPVRIVLQGRELGNRRVSGRFRLDDPELLARRLAFLLNLKAERSANIIVLRAG
ncbi:MAG: FecR domain-containing protein [Sphingobium sp.]|nr:FecR domain-containing protein [Sphingobium sp.]